MLLSIKLIVPVWILSFVLSPGIIFSQTKKIDSLKFLLVNAKEDTNKFRVYYNIADEYWAGLPDTIDFINTFKYEDSAYNLAKKISYEYGVFDCLMCYGNVSANQGKLPESKKYFNEAIEIIKKTRDKKTLADTYYEVGSDYRYCGINVKNHLSFFPPAVDYLYKALKVYEEIGSKYFMAKSWFFISSAHAWQNFFLLGRGNHAEIERSVLNAKKLFEESKETTKSDMAECNFLLGRAKYFQENYGDALQLFYLSLDYHSKDSNQLAVANDYLNIGRSFKGLADSSITKLNKPLATNLYTKALDYFYRSLKISTDIKMSGYMALCYLYIGTIQTNLKQFAQAKENLQKAIFYTDKLNGVGNYQEAYQSLAKLDSAEGNYKEALKNYNLYQEYKDRNTNNQTLMESQAFKLQFEFDKKEDSLKQVQIITETKLTAEKKQKYLYWGGLGLLALLSFFVFLNFRNQKKINRLAAEAYANERTELELQSLRAQLNPHFIFNCINSIDAFIHTNDKYNATVYLNKFARLLRNILDSSKLTTVPFAKDIETLKLYVELEELRHENKFSTQFNIEDELLNNDYKVPALIIQPFVENAILHGLKNKDGNEGLLEIDIKKTANNIVYIIKDNGIGRKAAGMISQNKESSYGMQLSYDRVRLFNKEQNASVKVTDLFSNGNVEGTQITVELKII